MRRVNQRIVVLDFGGQYCQLIARRIREAGVFCEILPYFDSLEKIAGNELHGIILSGGPDSVHGSGAKRCDPGVFDLGVPVLGICYGLQVMAEQLGGKTGKAEVPEFGRTRIRLDQSPLFEGIDKDNEVWMNHNDAVIELPDGFSGIASTDNCRFAAISDEAKAFYGVQFHPEVKHTEFGQKLLDNFAKGICGCSGDWKMEDLCDTLVADIKRKAGDGRVLSALSGGVDSSVASVLVHKAVGDRLTCIFVDHGLMRKNEAKEVLDYYKETLGLNIIFVDAAKRFLKKLEGVVEPERKRKIIGEEFIRVFEEEAAKLGDVDYLVQGTIYPDVIESGSGDGGAAVIKSHHNVGGLPENMSFKGIIEPLRMLFKDEVRALGESMGIPKPLIWRQPFPGPGLAIRIMGEITEDRLRIVRDSDAILREEVSAAGLEPNIWQYFTVFTGVQSVGVMGDQRTYDYVVAVRAVTSTDAMTVEFAELPYTLLKRLSERIINEVQGVNRVVYDVTSKPPGTIEWE